MSTGLLLWGLLFGAIGAGMAIYGRRQAAPVPLLSGLGLMIFPMFVTNTLALVGIGLALIAISYFLRF